MVQEGEITKSAAPGKSVHSWVSRTLPKLSQTGDFSDEPLVKTPGSQYREPGFDPLLGNETPHAATKTERSQINILTYIYGN